MIQIQVEDEEEEEDVKVIPFLSSSAITCCKFDEAWESNLKANQLIVKGVFGRVLNRDVIDVLSRRI